MEDQVMSAGKYSPTIRGKNFLPVKRVKGILIWDPDGMWDAEGYDMYGYNREGLDRDGKTEHDHNQAALREFLIDESRYEEAEKV
jgi:hypothetical protein